MPTSPVTTTFLKVWMRVTRLLLFFVAIHGCAVTSAVAHEVRPAIADLTLDNGQLRMTIDLNLEAFVANIDLAGLSDTDTSEKSGEYDRLRSLSPAELEIATRRFWPAMRNKIVINVGGARVTPKLAGLEIAPVGNAELPRSSRLTLMAVADGPVRVGWAKDFGRLIVRQQGVAEADAYTGMLSGGELTPAITPAGGASEGAWRTFVRYVAAGFEHIVPKGLDHILFVLGLFFLSTKLRPLLWQVTAFTLAHTVTLALGALGWVSAPASIVEPLIAASIVYVAVENVFFDGLSRWRPFVIFGFGLLHGMGFASVLGEFGLPGDQRLVALLGFNIGVEFGQLFVIAAAFLLVGLWFRNKPWYRQRISIPASCIIAAVGAWWAFERIFL